MFNRKFQKFDSCMGNVSKYIFETTDAVAEAVLYKYEDFYKRTVMCVSTMSGCPVGCKFCGTGKRFIRNLDHNEIVHQVQTMLADNKLSEINKAERFQIMFMSMGEPFLNYDNVAYAIEILHALYPNAELLISTVGINTPSKMQEFLQLSKEIDKVGLQFSIHEAYDTERNELIPYKNKMSLREIRDYGLLWSSTTGRPVYLNYCINDHFTADDLNRLKDLFSPIHFNFTFSVICSADETSKDSGYKDLNVLEIVANNFIAEGYNTRMFNPSGQDDIGGGCGQLWYVQRWMKEYQEKQKGVV